jgi:hypothetical protein
MGKSLYFPEITEKNTIIIIREFFTNFVAFFYQWETDMTTTGKNYNVYSGFNLYREWKIFFYFTKIKGLRTKHKLHYFKKNIKWLPY